MKGIHIRRAGFEDAHIISYLGKKTFAETFADLFSDDELNEYLDKTFSTDKLHTSLLKEENIFGILFYQDNPVGYYKIKLGRHYDHSADSRHIQLQKIYVLRDHLHLKLGKAMLNHILSLEEIKNCLVMWLVVLHTNSRAIQFYKTYGFKKLEIYYYTIGSQVLEYDLMSKDLQPFELFPL